MTMEFVRKQFLSHSKVVLNKEGGEVLEYRGIPYFGKPVKHPLDHFTAVAIRENGGDEGPSSFAIVLTGKIDLVLTEISLYQEARRQGESIAGFLDLPVRREPHGGELCPSEGLDETLRDRIRRMDATREIPPPPPNCPVEIRWHDDQTVLCLSGRELLTVSRTHLKLELLEGDRTVYRMGIDRLEEFGYGYGRNHQECGGIAARSDDDSFVFARELHWVDRRWLEQFLEFLIAFPERAREAAAFCVASQREPANLKTLLGPKPVPALELAPPQSGMEWQADKDGLVIYLAGRGYMEAFQAFLTRVSLAGFLGMGFLLCILAVPAQFPARSDWFFLWVTGNVFLVCVLSARFSDLSRFPLRGWLIGIFIFCLFLPVLPGLLLFLPIILRQSRSERIQKLVLGRDRVQIGKKSILYSELEKIEYDSASQTLKLHAIREQSTFIPVSESDAAWIKGMILNAVSDWSKVEAFFSPERLTPQYRAERMAHDRLKSFGACLGMGVFALLFLILAISARLVHGSFLEGIVHPVHWFQGVPLPLFCLGLGLVLWGGLLGTYHTLRIDGPAFPTPLPRGLWNVLAEASEVPLFIVLGGIDRLFSLGGFFSEHAGIRNFGLLCMGAGCLCFGHGMMRSFLVQYLFFLPLLVLIGNTILQVWMASIGKRSELPPTGLLAWVFGPLKGFLVFVCFAVFIALVIQLAVPSFVSKSLMDDRIRDPLDGNSAFWKAVRNGQR